MREAVALAAIIAAGCTDTPLTVHTRNRAASGLTPAEIGEIVTERPRSPGFRVRSPLLPAARTVSPVRRFRLIRRAGGPS